MVGGIETLVYQTVKGKGENVTVVAPDLPGAEKFDHENLYRPYRITCPQSTPLRILFFFFHLFFLHLRGVRGKYLCANIFSAVPLWPLSYIFNIDFTVYILGKEVTILNTPLRSTFYKGIMKKVFSRANRIISISDFTTQSLVEFGIGPAKISKVPMGIDRQHFDKFAPDHFEIFKKEIFQKYQLSPDCQIVLTLSRIVERKGHDKVLESWPEVQNSYEGNVVYFIIGDGPYRPNLEKIASDLNINSSVHFTGKVDFNDLIYWYHLADVFIMPSRFIKETSDAEGFGLVFLEANYCETAVIGGNSGGIPDAVEHQKSGLLVDPLNTKEISEQIVYLLKNPKIREQMATYGKERVNKTFNYEQTRKSTFEILFFDV